jgi:RNA polymerase sigma-70 factor (ECF subfamily)
MLRQADRVLDEYLVVATAAGDRAAGELLVRRWQSKLVGHAYRLTGDKEAARDAVQTAWSEIMRGLGRLHDERAFPAWAFRIVSRTCAKQVQQSIRIRALTHAMLIETPEVTSCDPHNEVDADRLRAAVRTLPVEQRAAVALFYFEELSVAEVAVALDVPSGTVKTRLLHARRKLRAVLEGEL